MKRIITIIILVVLAMTNLNSQNYAPPQAFSYKAIIVRSNGSPVISQQVSLKINILKGSNSGASVYEQITSAFTNLQGQIDIIIGGDGTDFANIAWHSDKYYLVTMFDIKGGKNWQPLSNAQLLSVPYALYAGNAAPNGINIGDMKYWDGTKWVTLPVGSNGQMLTVANGHPTWATVVDIFPSLRAIFRIGNITNASDQSISIHVWIDDDRGIPFSSQGICWSTFTNPTISDSRTIEPIRDPNYNKFFSSDVTGLNPNTLYYLRVYGTSAIGTSYGFNDPFYLNQLAFLTPGGQTGTITDIDGNIYKTVDMGGQWWMAENLRTTRYSNGDQILTTTPANLDISNESEPKYQWAYNGDESFTTPYGRLYTWYAATDSRNICPSGWHVPSTTEYRELFSKMPVVVGGGSFPSNPPRWGSGVLLMEEGSTHWGSSNVAIDLYGFTALPGGLRPVTGGFASMGSIAYFLTTTPYSASSYCIELSPFSAGAQVEVSSRKVGISVRCLRDSP